MSNKTQKLRTVTFKAMYWTYEEDLDDNLILYISGLTKEQKTVLVKVEGFTPFVYLELPRKISWNSYKCKQVFKYFKDRMKSEGPIRFKMFERYLIHYKKKVNTIFMSFPTHKACRSIANACTYSRNIYIPGVGAFRSGDLKVHEHNIDPVLKFTASQNINLSGWIDAKETIPEDEIELNVEERKFATTDIDMCVHWKDVNPHKSAKEVMVSPLYCSFDIECYSKNHNSKLPDPEIPENVIIQVGMIFGRLGDPDSKRKKILLSLQNPHDIKGAQVIRCMSERKLLLKFTSLIKQYNPDIFIGYNIMKFDWNYMLKRAEISGIYLKFMELSRIVGKRAELKKMSWSSSAYGEQKFQYPNCHGRVNVDVLLEVERSYRLPKYTLNAVSEKFLKDKKDDITARQMFMLTQLTNELLPKVQNKKLSKMKLRFIKRRIRNILELRRTHGVVRELRRKLLTATSRNIERYIRDGFTIIGEYCIQDCILPIRLAEKLNLWTSMEQMANVMHVPTSYLHSRGQQIRVLAQVYRETILKGIIIPHKGKTKYNSDKFQGAIVIEANPGDYDNVGTLDFASLYPTVMIAFNICYTTILEDEDPTPDSECHVLIWSDHVACEHDPQKRKRKKEDVLCTNHRYRFRKLKISYNEKTKEVIYEHEGLMPRLERNLLATRKEVKKEMFKAQSRLKMHKGLATEGDLKYFKSCKWNIIKKGSLGKNEALMLEVTAGVLNAKQLAVKVSCNSMYGAMGARNGFIPLIPGAASVTAMGRKLITMAIDKIRDTYDCCKLVYGDSVTGDTPVVCRLNGKILIRTIDNLPSLKENLQTWLNFQGDPKQYQIPHPSLEVWTEQGFTKIKKIIRHKTKKKLYRITSHTGAVKVTEDHSLLNENAQKVRPKNVKIGSKLLTSDLPKIKGINSITDAWVWGFFYGDGSCGGYDCPSGKKYSWALNNQNMDYLNKAKRILERDYPNYSFSILDTIKSSGVYKLIVKGNVKKWVTRWRRLFYDKEKYKKVPDEIFTANLVSRKAFFEGYYAADGDKDVNGYTRLSNKGQIGSMGLYLLATSLGYKVSVNTRKDKPHIYRLTMTKNKQRKHPGVIKKIEDLGFVNDYVYDLETENHHFSAGVGQLVVHNTDSCMIKFMGKSLDQSFDLSIEASHIATHYLKTWIMGVDENFTVSTPSGKHYTLNKIHSKDKDFQYLEYADKIKVLIYESIPIDLEFENMYGRFFLLTKKRYLAYSVNRKNEIIGETKKGVVLTRRDNCQYLKNVYGYMVKYILDQKDKEQIMYTLYDKVNELFTRRVPDTDLIIYMGVKSVISYATKKEKKSGRNVIEVVYLDEYKQPIIKPIGPLDPRLVYRNIPQALLSLKMLKRGTDIPPNTRLEFLYLENETATHQGDKAEDFTYYSENKDIEKLKPDYLHYLEKQLTKPVTELLNVKFPKSPVIFEKMEDGFNRIMFSDKLSTLKRVRLAKLRKYQKNIPDKISFKDICIGWDALSRLSKKKSYKNHINEKRISADEDKLLNGYTFSSKEAKVTYVIDSSKRQGMLEFNSKNTTEAELINICWRWKARHILDRFYNYHGQKKRPTRKPTQISEKLRVNTQVILKRKIDDWKKGSFGKVIESKEVGEDDTKKKKSYTFNILMDEKREKIIYDVPRKSIGTYYFKDSFVMKDILIARVAYKKVVNDLNDLFIPVVFKE